MPTENRSSDTDQPQIEAASAAMAQIRTMLGREQRPDQVAAALEACDWSESPIGNKAIVLSAIQVLRATQPNAEPIAWMVGTAFWWTKEEAERDAASTGLPIVGLGPMVGVAHAEQHQGEPVMRLECEKLWGGAGEYAVDFVKPGWLQECRQKGGTFLLYTHPAPADPNVRWKAVADEQMEVIAGLKAEVERLRAALKFYADREHYHFESGNWDTVSGEPLTILWCGEEPDFIEDGTVARNALSASAEPSATGDGVRDERDYAIEHAGYLADAADQVLADYQAYSLAQMLENEAGDDGDGEHEEAVDSARDDLHEGLANLRSMAYEFRKRRSQASNVACAEPSAPVEPSADEVRQQHHDVFMQRRETRAALEHESQVKS
ncbi:hypothetical protein [Pseudomonas fulva]|uniref:hypothetical protein n=1 Tax=Pseudomonas fulva TaxID=47880 RepID=UPI002B1D7B5A|nr:hypothetical protein [Pseudomonas fulva]